MIKSLYFLVLLWLAYGFASAQVVYPSSDVVDPLSSMGAGSRASAMGSAFAAGNDDDEALFYNPSGLSSIREVRLTLHHYSGFTGLHNEWLNVAYPLSPGRVFALSLNYLGFGSMESRDVNGVYLGDQNPYRMGLTASGGITLGKSCAVGSSVLILHRAMPGERFTTVRFDCGMQWAFSGRVRAGLACRGMGPYVGRHRPAMVNQAGLMVNPFRHNDLCLSLDLTVQPFSSTSSINAGIEIPLQQRLLIRAGSRIPLSEDEREGFRHLTSGVGYLANRFSLNYAFIPEGEMGTTHYISLSLRFPDRGGKSVAVSVTAAETPMPSAVINPPTSPQIEDDRTSASGSVIGPVPSPVPTVPGEKLRIYFQLPPQTHVSSELNGKIKETELKLKRSNEDADVWLELGGLYEQVGRISAALQCYQQVLRLVPDQIQAAARLQALQAVPSPTPSKESSRK